MTLQSWYKQRKKTGNFDWFHLDSCHPHGRVFTAEAESAIGDHLRMNFSVPELGHSKNSTGALLQCLCVHGWNINHSSRLIVSFCVAIPVLKQNLRDKCFTREFGSNDTDFDQIEYDV
jgi:hypothetical protein